MNISSLLLAAIAVLLSGAVGLTMAVRAYLRYRGKRVITSPETANHAAVHVNVVNAAREAVFGDDIRLEQCSCWPERQNCDRSASHKSKPRQNCDRSASHKSKPTRKVAWTGTWSTIGTRASPVPIAKALR